MVMYAQRNKQFWVVRSLLLNYLKKQLDVLKNVSGIKDEHNFSLMESFRSDKYLASYARCARRQTSGSSYKVFVTFVQFNQSWRALTNLMKTVSVVLELLHA
jgi:hypothetical protein